MDAANVIIGSKFARWTVKELYTTGTQYPSHLCECECGVTRPVRVAYLLKNLSKSCGCFRRDATSRRAKKHGRSNTRLNSIWRAMRARCRNKNHSRYEYYGGRGVVVCRQWEDSFTVFELWANDNGYHKDLSIDRIDTNGNYEPSNCRWATQQQQVENRRNARVVTAWGETKSLTAWTKDLRCSVGFLCVHARLSRGWKAEKAISQPARKLRR